jgi:uncharacterized protein (TIGR02246 family)
MKRRLRMKKLLMVIPLVFLLSFIFGCQKGEEMTEEVGIKALSDEDVAAIKASTEAYVQAVKSEDWTTLAALYTEDAVLMPPNQPIVQGREAIQAYGEAFPPTTEFSITPVDIEGRGDLAFVRGTGTWTLTPEGAPEPIQETSKYVEIRRKQEDGSWLIAVDIFNSDMPLPSPPEKE